MRLEFDSPHPDQKRVREADERLTPPAQRNSELTFVDSLSADMDEFEKFYNNALKFLSYRPRSEQEIRKRLTQKKTPQEMIDRIISKLKEQKFLNDKEFTRWWIEQRTKFRPRALRLIKIELKQKGIGTELIDSVIQNLKFRIQDDLMSASKLIEKKLPKYKNLDSQEKFQKLSKFLASKGYSYDIIKEIIKRKR